MAIPRTKQEISRRLGLLKSLSDGKRSSRDIQDLMTRELGYQIPRSYVVNMALKHNLPRNKPVNILRGRESPNWRHGRRITCAGYALVPAPSNHPHARARGDILEHRLVMEQKIGRHLLPEEAVDHIDGLRLHNDPDNLRLFASNAEHLKATISGQTPRWTKAGEANVVRGDLRGSGGLRVNTHQKLRASGDYRLLQCIQILLKFGTDHPFACGTHHHLEKRQIDYSSRTNLERALGDLYARWGWDQIP